jgi:hypothetical protein
VLGNLRLARCAQFCGTCLDQGTVDGGHPCGRRALAC